jgi:hypothetical protein
MQVGDTIFLAWTNTHHGEVAAVVTEATIVLVDGDRIVIRTPADTIRQPSYGETICRSEAEAWAVCSLELADTVDRVREKLEECQQRAARGRITA